jgi:Leucine-rich repeat (LRR) protein
MLSYYTDIIAQDNSLVELEFTTLDVRSRHIKFINDIDTKLMFISRLYLDNNSLKSLDGIWQFKNLEEFQFNFNYVEDKDEFIKIKNPFFMKNLSYIGNPV